jgi:hypothetical protein
MVPIVPKVPITKVQYNKPRHSLLNSIFMNYQIFLIGILVLVIFITPFYYVIRSSKNSERKAEEINKGISATPAAQSKKSK